MAFDQPTRNLLSNFVSDARQLLTEEFTRQLQHEYGMDPSRGEVSDLDTLDHLDDLRLETARILRETLAHYEAGAPKKGRNARIDALQRIVREQAFTVLNRLCALRMAEARDLLVESIARGQLSDGFQLYARLAGSALGETGEAYRNYLFSLFDEFTLDLPVLFDRFSPEGRLFPRETILSQLLEAMRQPELEPLWAEDETIGWIYQYFNSAEERRQMRSESSAPRNSRELAVRNQFFTPRYVVEFLADNTLGRIWYEMQKGETALKESCQYLVRRPNEIFLAPGEEAPAQSEAEADLSQEELLKQPVHIEHRPKKDPRDLKILDPACGSGHFLLYAFDLLELIYEEAWADLDSPESEVTGNTLCQDFKSLEMLTTQVPRLIIEHNLHGIDIDRRAIQIAGLALWLRAQKSWKKLGLAPLERPQISISNLVTAEPMPGDESMRKEFIDSLQPRVLGQLVEVVFEKMELAGEAGSLLKIEEEIKDAIAEAKRQWMEKPEPEQKHLFPEMEKSIRPRQQEIYFDFTGITDGQFWDESEDRILGALDNYAESAHDGHAIRRRLFSQDAAQGLAFIDVSQKHDDVILMSPPFGGPSPRSESFIANEPAMCSNLFCAFIIRGKDLLKQYGFIGSITDRSFVVKATYQKYREWLYSNSSPQLFVDLGWNVLDSNVEACAYIVGSNQQKDTGLFNNASNITSNEIATELNRRVSQHLDTGTSFVQIAFNAFSGLPNRSMSYWLPSTLLYDFSSGETLDVTGGHPARGMSSGKTAFACRLIWEVPVDLIGTMKRWNPVNVGGGIAAFYRPPFMVFFYEEDWGCMRAFPGFSLKNTALYWQPAIGWGKRTDILTTQLLFNGMITAEDGQLVVPNANVNIWALLGFLNSQYAQTAIHAICGGHKGPGYLAKIPFRRNLGTSNDIIEIAQEGYWLQRAKFLIDETTYDFISPFIHSSGEKWIEETLTCLSRCDTQTYQLLTEINSVVYKTLGKSEFEVSQINEISPGSISLDIEWPRNAEDIHAALVSYVIGSVLGRWDIRITLDSSLAPNPIDPLDSIPSCSPGMLLGPDALPAKAGNIVSEAWLSARPDANNLPPEGSVETPTIPDSEYPLRISWDGILVDDPGFRGAQHHNEDIIRRVREALDLLWGEKSHEIELEACDMLGVKSLRDYFRKASGFFDDHLKRYSKSRRYAPIYWPLSTESGSYTLWLYYHRISDQILFTCVNDYLDPKLKQVAEDLQKLKLKHDRSAADEEELAYLSDLELELKGFRQELLRIAEFWKPNLNDGVQITAAPLWKLFPHRAWQKRLKKTWQEMEAGEYDWAHLAYSIWPERVREKCKQDKSLAIAHDLEQLYEGD